MGFNECNARSEIRVKVLEIQISIYLATKKIGEFSVSGGGRLTRMISIRDFASSSMPSGSSISRFKIF